MGKKKGSKPKITEQEKMSAAVGLAEYKIFKKLYLGTEEAPGPLLTMRNQAQKEDFSNLFAARSGADIMQGISRKRGKVSSSERYAATMAGAAATDVVGEALTKGASQASENALKAKATQQTQVLAAARKQAASNQQSLSNSASIDSSLVLAKYNAKVERQGQQMAMLTDFVGKGVEEYGSRKAIADEEARIKARGPK